MTKLGGEEVRGTHQQASAAASVSVDEQNLSNRTVSAEIQPAAARPVGPIRTGGTCSSRDVNRGGTKQSISNNTVSAEIQPPAARPIGPIATGGSRNEDHALAKRTHTTQTSCPSQDIPDKGDTATVTVGDIPERSPQGQSADAQPGRPESGQSADAQPGHPESSEGAPQKRRYAYVTRSKQDEPGPSEKRRRFMTRAALTESSFEGMTCCQRKKCFSIVNLSHVVATSKRVMLMTNAERKESLRSLLNDSNMFVFDGRLVCTEFLVKAFRFSRDLQTTVKQTENVANQRRENITYAPESKTIARDSVAVFLRRIADQTGNIMPDSDEVHLPFYDKKQVYEVYCDQYRALYNTTPPVISIFYSTWKKDAFNIKIRRVTKFTKCAVCESFKDAFQNAAKNVKRLAKLQVDRQAHYNHIARERQAYLMNQENAKLDPSEYMSIAVDGADQSAFGIPHFVTITKDTKGHALKVKLIGLLEHCMDKRVALYTMTEDHETGANHVIECIHRYLNSRNDRLGLPKVLFVQMDNCTRENKNRYTLGYLECLVLWGVFQEVYASFLPVGHTHIDVDQLFSRTATRLHRHSAVTLEDLHEQLRLSYTPVPTVNHVSKIANISGLCDKTSVLWDGRDGRFSDYRYFRFHKTERTFDEVQRGSTVFTTCQVKRNSADNWSPLRPDVQGKEFSGFLQGRPDLRQTPKTMQKCPTDKNEVLKRLVSEESRIGDTKRMKSVTDLVDLVYQDRMSDFHWDLKNSVEHKRTRSEEVGALQVNRDATDTAQYTYKVNQFVAVKHEQSTDKEPFWIGRISRLKKTDGKVTSLVVHWFEQSGGDDIYKARYKQTNKTPHGKKFTPWSSDIPTESVMVTFDGLTSRKQISVETCKKIQASIV